MNNSTASIVNPEAVGVIIDPPTNTLHITGVQPLNAQAIHIDERSTTANKLSIEERSDPRRQVKGNQKSYLKRCFATSCFLCCAIMYCCNADDD